MSPRQSDARQRVVSAAAEMLSRHGLNATSIRETAKRANAPFGSTYHHFPGGKHEVVVEAVTLAGRRVAESLDHQLRAGMAAGLEGFLAAWRDMLVQSEFRVGCPVMAAAVEEPIDDIAEDVLSAAARVFDDWKNKLAVSLEAEGWDRASASGLATLIVAGLEGAVVLCRAQRSIAAFDQVCEQLHRLVRHA